MVFFGGALAITEKPIDRAGGHADHLVVLAEHRAHLSCIDPARKSLTGHTDEPSGFGDGIMLLDWTAVRATLIIHLRRYRAKKTQQLNWVHAGVSIAVSNRRSTLLS